MSEARRAFVARLRAKRIALKLRLEDVADLVQVHRMTVCHWERGRQFPRREKARAWAEALGVRVVNGSLDELWPPPPCGTPGGYKRHSRRGERCPECWQAWSTYNTAAHWRRKGTES